MLAQYSKEIIAFYNVENLFPPDPQSVHFLDPTPSGLKNWDERKYQIKIRKIAEVFELIQEENGEMPMIIGLAEIKGNKPVQDLLSKEVLKGYCTVQFDGTDARGMGVVILYNPIKLKLLEAQSLNFAEDFVHEGELKRSRSILKCRFQMEDFIFTVYLLHLPSQRKKNIKINLRKQIVQELKEEILQHSKHEPVIIMGDFNENPDEEIISSLYQLSETRKFNNPFLRLFQNGVFSAYHNQNGLLFDQILLSEDFFQDSSRLKFCEEYVFKPLRLHSSGKKFAGRPARTFAGTRYLGGYSDHFPVLVSLIKN